MRVLLVLRDKYMKKSWWPVWFPYPSSWLRSIVLILAMGVLVFSVRIFGLTGFFLYQATNNMGLFVRLLFIGLIFPFVLIIYLHHFLINRGKRPAGWSKRLPSPRSISEGFYALNVFILSSAIVMGIGISFCDPDRSCENISDATVGLISIFWVVILAYFYQAEYLVRKFSAKPSSSSESPFPVTNSQKASISPTESLDMEIEQMRKDLGLR